MASTCGLLDSAEGIRKMGHAGRLDPVGAGNSVAAVQVEGGCCRWRIAEPVGSVVEVGRSRGVVVSFLYWLARRLLELFVLRMRSERRLRETEDQLLPSTWQRRPSRPSVRISPAPRDNRRCQRKSLSGRTENAAQRSTWSRTTTPHSQVSDATPRRHHRWSRDRCLVKFRRLNADRVCAPYARWRRS
jgi:hypothetical protein